MAEQPAKKGKRRIKEAETVPKRTAKVAPNVETTSDKRQSKGRFRRAARLLLPRFFINSWRELKLVEWPGRRLSLRLTGAVIIFALIFGLTIAAVDFVLDKIFRQLIIG